MKRIGIFAGSFDPAHKGHIAFALQALKDAKLDEVYFLPEIKPRGKASITHIGHRVAMLQLALGSHQHLQVLELSESQFTIAKTWPKLKDKFKNDQLFLLLGSNTMNSLGTWPHIEALLKDAGIIIGVHKDKDHIHQNSLPQSPRELLVIDSSWPSLSSKQIREDIGKTGSSPNLLPSLRKYVQSNWLYSVATPNSSA